MSSKLVTMSSAFQIPVVVVFFFFCPHSSLSSGFSVFLSPFTIGFGEKAERKWGILCHPNFLSLNSFYFITHVPEIISFG